MAEKAGYKHFMLKEIFEQPTAARETVLGRVSQDSGKVFLEEMKLSDETLAGIDASPSWPAAPRGTQR
jgi:glucosamine--fructose-6-phosphate aminotransferase (isomerizing)